MKKNWWLKLYTIPVLKMYLTAFVLLGIFDSLLGWVLLTPFLCMYFAYKFTSKSRTSFKQNLDFHALHVPLKELKDNFFLHSFILGMTSLVFGLILYFSRPETEFGSAVGPFYPFMLWCGLICAELLKAPKQRLSDDIGVVKRLFSFFIGFIFLLITVAMTSTYLDKFFAIGTFFAGYVVSVIFVYFKVLFHEIKQPATFKYRFKTTAISVCTTFILAMTMGFLATRDFNHSNLDAVTKLEVLRLWPGFVKQVSPESLMEMGRHLQDGEDFVLVYRKMKASDLQSISLNYHLSDTRRLTAYLRYGQPPHSDFMQIADSFSRYENEWKKKYGVRQVDLVKGYLRQFWPPNTELHSMFQENKTKGQVEGVEREIATIEEKQAHVEREPEIEE